MPKLSDWRSTVEMMYDIGCMKHDKADAKATRPTSYILYHTSKLTYYYVLFGRIPGYALARMQGHGSHDVSH
ncbi:hypothetical protein BH09BAC4_BH09BAC4_40630 [soil metagenome]